METGASDNETIIGIDLGTTNSEVAILDRGKPTIVPDAGEAIHVDFEPLEANVDTAIADAATTQTLWEEAPDNESFVHLLGDRRDEMPLPHLCDYGHLELQLQSALSAGQYSAELGFSLRRSHSGPVGYEYQLVGDEAAPGDGQIRAPRTLRRIQGDGRSGNR